MNSENNKLESTIIVSVYKDASALRLILESLTQQTSQSFEVIISEDGESNCIKECLENFDQAKLNIRHLTQKDDGFRKNIALNRAIKSSNTDHLIFIDGDCVLHPAFISAHQACALPGSACSGRRLELGPNFSLKLRSNPAKLTRLTNRFLFFINIPSLFLDKAKNIESGTYSKLLQFITKTHKTRLLGCNFSCRKQDLININGFNEEYLEAGTGEDSDIDFRLVKSGVIIKKVKFSAIQYHLNHPRSYGISERNIELLNITRASNTCTCQHGLKYIPDSHDN